MGLTLLVSYQASAVNVIGKEFAGYTNQLVGSNGGLITELGTGAWSTSSTDIANAVTDINPATFVIGTSADAYVDLAFSAAATDGVGDDLEIFFVGANGHEFTVQLFSGSTGSSISSLSLGPQAGYTGFVTSTFADGIYSMGIDIGDFGLTGPVDVIRLGLGDGYTANSSVVSFVGAATVVPVPAAVWMFGSGLIGLVGIARRCRS
jgi:hypothetical protein